MRRGVPGGVYRPEPYIESVCFRRRSGEQGRLLAPRHSASRFKLSFPVSYRHRTPVRVTAMVTARTGRGDARRAAEKRPESGLGRISVPGMEATPRDGATVHGPTTVRGTLRVNADAR
jgi:hypothetical protein